MARTTLTVREIFELLPGLEELEGARLSIIAAAAPDPEKAWARSGLYATVDQRVIGGEALEAAVRAAESAQQAQLATLYAAMRAIVRGCIEGDEIGAARALIGLGETLEEWDQHARARAVFETALARTLPLVDKELQLLALRRIARVSLRLGDLERAHDFYRRCALLACDAGHLRAEVIALTGLGNVAQMQGRWADVEARYRAALAKLEAGGAGDELRLERGQLFNNLGMITTRRNREAEAEGWFARAREVWAEIDSPNDLAVCYHNMAVLRERQGRRDEARTLLAEALPLSIAPALRAALTIDLALLHLSDGQVGQAEVWARQAEEHAIAAQSPYYLGRLYCGLGNIARARGDADGLVFYEKALEIARDRDLSYLEGDTLLEYARLRASIGGADEARSYLERAREIFAALGTLDELEQVERLLLEIPPASAGTTM